MEHMVVSLTSMNMKSKLKANGTELVEVPVMTDVSITVKLERLLDSKYNDKVSEMKVCIYLYF